MQKILVTGGAGFIGSNLIEKLLENKSNEVYSLDNYSTGKIENHIKGATYIKGDTADIEKLIDFIPDIIYHLGEYSRVEQSLDEVEKVWDYNIKGTFAVLEFCRKNKIKIVYAGSSTKFSNNNTGKFLSPYTWTKATNTELVSNYGSWFGLPFAITYFYNVYGNREISSGKYATLIAIFKEKSKNNEQLPVVSPGTQIRNFTNVDDIVKGLIIVGEKGFGDGYCLGSEEGYSILDIAKIFGGNINMLPERNGNRMDSSIDLSKTRNELGWNAKIKVSDYIKDFINNKSK